MKRIQYIAIVMAMVWMWVMGAFMTYTTPNWFTIPLLMLWAGGGVVWLIVRFEDLLT